MKKQNMIDAALAFLGNRRQSIPSWPEILSTLGYMSFFHRLASLQWTVIGNTPLYPSQATNLVLLLFIIGPKFCFSWAVPQCIAAAKTPTLC